MDCLRLVHENQREYVASIADRPQGVVVTPFASSMPNLCLNQIYSDWFFRFANPHNARHYCHRLAVICVFSACTNSHSDLGHQD